MLAGHAADAGALSSSGRLSGQAGLHALSRPEARGSGRARSQAAVAFKKDIHPKYYQDAKVICNGEEVMTTSGCSPEYVVDIWSGNHPFYQGGTEIVLTADSRINHFSKRYGDLDMGKPGPQTAGGEKKLVFKAKAMKEKKKSRKGK